MKTRKMQHRQMKLLDEGHTAGKGQKDNSNQGFGVSGLSPFSTKMLTARIEKSKGASAFSFQ